MRQIPSTAALRAFEAAGRHMSFLKAAEELNVTAGAVSRQIKALEVMLEAPLFERRNRQITLTALGRNYLDDIREPLNQIAEASRQVRLAGPRQVISLIAYPTFAIRWLIPRWGSLYKRFPEINLRLTTTLDVSDFQRADYDLAIQMYGENETRPGLCIDKMLDVITTPVACPSLAEKVQVIDDLKNHTLLHSDPRPSDWRHWLDFAGATGFDCETGLHFENANLAIHAAIEGLGVAIGLEALIEDELASGRLVKLFDLDRRSNTAFQIVYAEAKAANPLLQSVRDWLIEEASESTRAPEAMLRASRDK